MQSCSLVLPLAITLWLLATLLCDPQPSDHFPVFLHSSGQLTPLLERYSAMSEVRMVVCAVCSAVLLLATTYRLPITMLLNLSMAPDVPRAQRRRASSDT